MSEDMNEHTPLPVWRIRELEPTRIDVYEDGFGSICNTLLGKTSQEIDDYKRARMKQIATLPTLLARVRELEEACRAAVRCCQSTGPFNHLRKQAG